MNPKTTILHRLLGERKRKHNDSGRDDSSIVSYQWLGERGTEREGVFWRELFYPLKKAGRRSRYSVSWPFVPCCYLISCGTVVKFALHNLVCSSDCGRMHQLAPGAPGWLSCSVGGPRLVMRVCTQNTTPLSQPWWRYASERGAQSAPSEIHSCRGATAQYACP